MSQQTAMSQQLLNDQNQLHQTIFRSLIYSQQKKTLTYEDRGQS